MAKSHTDETDEFNDFITRYGNYKRFSADKIHSEKEIKWLFDWIFHFILPPVSLSAFHFFESQTSI